MRRALVSLLLAVVVAALTPAAARSIDIAGGGSALPLPSGPGLRAGVGVVDFSWHVGAGSGQHGSDGNGLANALQGGETDPNLHGTKKGPSHGIQSRLTARALVLEGSNGERVALVKTDNYLAQDLLVRRAAQLVDPTLGLPHDRIVMSVTHDHSSPYYSTAAAGVWIFQDVWDVRAFEYQARQIAAAITEAATSMVPARLGATTVDFSGVKGNVAGRGTSTDGSPYGYPVDFGDQGVVVLRVDDVSGKKPVPLATWMNFGQHPESLAEYNLISADFVAPLERFVERDTGGPLVFSQGDVGSAEGPTDAGTLPDGTRRAWYHTGFAQSERFARLLADKVVEGWARIGEGDAQVPFTRDVPVNVFDAWVPGPVSHPYPAANACRADDTLAGDPGVGTAAECSRAGTGAPLPLAKLVEENLAMHGIHLAVPDNYDAPAFGAVEENARLHLQAVKLGDILLASCACEAQVDLILNLESRTDKVQGNIWDGFDWTADDCRREPAGTWTCRIGGVDRTGISAAAIAHMQQQVHEDALGWDDPLYAPFANDENPADIKGNFTKSELPADLGYTLAVGLGHTGDYNGYTVSYREYMARDHYRKALTSYGPHTADYMVTRLVRMAAALNGGPAYDPATDEPLGAVAVADEARQAALAALVGQISGPAYDGYEQTLPDDLNVAAVRAQPASIERFAGTSFSWVGGQNYVDNPVVRVERKKGKTWETFADQTGEVQVKVQLPAGVEGFADARVGSHEWVWTAGFEAFDPAPARVGQTPAGTYRFVVDGVARVGGTSKPYRVESAPFTVSRYTGLRPEPSVDASGNVVIPRALTYPTSYATSPFEFINDDEEDICRRCTFRAWARTGSLAAATVTVVRASGAVERIAAVVDGGRLVARTALQPNDTAYLAAFDATDAWGETNGTTVEIIR